LVHGVGTFISQSKDDDAWFVHYATRKKLAEVEVECQNNSGIRAGAFDEIGISGALESQSSDVNRIVAKLLQELNGPGRDTTIRQKPHRSGAQWMKFILREGSGIGECLANVFLFEVRQLLDDPGRRHAVGNEVDNVGH